ncbi:ornithine carbamoyltransferase [Cenarchaeum symbiosum A]|uniref:Ornithine carbamoyltransferase n=1 Tax=Cenarchaeum symbiosum (strain A) TaxID=414004 RepID=OTC_CENSY|nr:RecName: Full=Ornithine carbamoyltransferase; Short=OTCase [Cenarchaeum symbiosum A]ABK76966.1 ornithine carbamoyltransferase [Cenarchaeum symbiosum A]
MKIRSKDLLTGAELDRKEILGIIESAIRLKKGGRSKAHPLDGRTLAMVFQKPSTRTRVSFAAGMFQLGGEAIYLPPGDMQLSRGETIPDTARALSGYVDVIVARVFGHETIEEIAASASVPVINGLSDTFHPCQILADLMTIKERKGRLKGLRAAWIGDGNNVCNSLLYGCAAVGIDISVATPAVFRPIPGVVDKCRESIDVKLTTDPAEAAAGADIVFTDTFASIHNMDKERERKFLPKYRVNAPLMKKAADDAIFMHCLPAKRGQEVDGEVIDGPQSAVWDEAENRLHSQKALLLALGI